MKLVLESKNVIDRMEEARRKLSATNTRKKNELRVDFANEYFKGYGKYHFIDRDLSLSFNSIESNSEYCIEFQNETSETLDFILPISGDLHVHCPSRSIDAILSPGKIYLLKEGSHKGTIINYKNNCSIDQLTFRISLEKISQFFSEDLQNMSPNWRNSLLKSDETFFYPLAEKTLWKQIFTTTRYINLETPWDKMYWESETYLFMSHIFRAILGSPNESKFRQNQSTFASRNVSKFIDERVDAVKGMIDCENEKNLRVSDLATRIGISESSLQRAFQQKFHISVHQYQKKIRMEKAVEFLNAGCSIIETTNLLGYSNPSHFAHEFQKQYGLTPKKYQQSKLLRKKLGN